QGHSAIINKYFRVMVGCLSQVCNFINEPHGVEERRKFIFFADRLAFELPTLKTSQFFDNFLLGSFTHCTSFQLNPEQLKIATKPSLALDHFFCLLPKTFHFFHTAILKALSNLP